MTCIIIDDEPIARMGIEDLIFGVKGLVLLRTFNSTLGVEDFLKKNSVHLIFLDIEMPGMTGVEFAPLIPANTLIIFITAYSEYALESYELDAIDYLVKPVMEARFIKAVAKAFKYHHLLTSDDSSNVESYTDVSISIRADRRNYHIPYEDILYIEALKDHVIICTKHRRLITWMNLKTFFSRLPHNNFGRISRRHVVNFSKIKSYNNHLIYIDDDIEINIGKAYQKEFFDHFRK